MEKDFKKQVQEAGERFAISAEGMLKALEAARNDDDDAGVNAAQAEIDEYPLSVLTRSGWRPPGSDPGADAEYEILLSTGGPASRIRGELGDYCDPVTAVFEFQDWFKPWTAADLDEEQKAILLEFASHFYFGG